MKLKITNVKHLAHINPKPGQRKVGIELEGIVTEAERDRLVDAFQHSEVITHVGTAPEETDE